MIGKNKKTASKIILYKGQAKTSSNTKSWPLDSETLVTFGADKGISENDFCMSHAFTGVQVFGSTGSGKSSASVKTLIKSYLKAGLGGLVLTAKTDELESWIEMADETGRSDDLISFSPNNDYRFDFMRYELQRKGSGAGQTEKSC